MNTRTAWRSVAEHRALAVLLCAALPVEIAASANLVLRVGSVDSAGGGALGIGGAFAAMSLAFAVAVIPAGIVVDRTPARRTFAVALAIRALPMLIGGLLAVNGTLTTTTVVALAAGDGLAMALLRPSWQHFQACLLPDDAARDAALLDDWIARAGALFGALAGGVAVAIGHTGTGLILCAAGFLPLLAALVLGLGAAVGEPISTSAPTRALREAWSALRGAPRLAQATRSDVVLALALPVGVLAPAITVALSAVQYLWLIALAAGAGALAGTTWVTMAWHRECPAQLLRRAAALLVGVLTVQAVVLAGGFLAPTPGWLAFGCLTVTLTEAAMTAMFAVTSSIVQADAPQGVRGAVTGLAQAPKHIATFLSASAVGITMAWAGPAVSVAVIAVAVAAAAVWLRGFAGVANPGSDAARYRWSGTPAAPVRQDDGHAAGLTDSRDSDGPQRGAVHRAGFRCGSGQPDEQHHDLVGAGTGDRDRGVGGRGDEPPAPLTTAPAHTHHRRERNRAALRTSRHRTAPAGLRLPRDGFPARRCRSTTAVICS